MKGRSHRTHVCNHGRTFCGRDAATVRFGPNAVVDRLADALQATRVLDAVARSETGPQTPSAGALTRRYGHALREGELAPRVYDNRIARSDAERRWGKELKRGATLAAVSHRVQSQRSYGLRDEQLTERDFYQLVETGLIEDGQVIATARYRSDGRVRVNDNHFSLAQFAVAPYDAVIDESKRPPVRGRFP